MPFRDCLRVKCILMLCRWLALVLVMMATVRVPYFSWCEPLQSVSQLRLRALPKYRWRGHSPARRHGVTWRSIKLAARDPEHDLETLLWPIQELSSVTNATLHLFGDKEIWMNPVSLATRGDVIVLGSRLSQIGAFMTIASTCVIKAIMISRISAGLPPVEDDFTFEYGGRLFFLVSGILWPMGQLTLTLITILSAGTLLLEESKRDLMTSLGVDMQVHRQRRLLTTALLAASLFLIFTPPFLGTESSYELVSFSTDRKSVV